METYTIVRRFYRGHREVIAEGVTLEEAQAHCQDPETSSSTCTGQYGKALTELSGPWFDCYTKE